MDANTCECLQENIPVPCVDDGICSNGEEVWDANTCECLQENIPVPCVDDGICANGEEVWDANTCECLQENIPVPCVDDGDCTNGFEAWDASNCECIVTPPVLGCTDPMANNYDPLATCDDNSCTYDCPDPGTCDDGDCTNGIETWNDVLCECEAGTPIDCTNGPTIQLTCDDGDPCTLNDMITVLECDNSVICLPCEGFIPSDCSSGATTTVACDDGDPCTINDVEIILDCDGSVCEPCMGITVDCSDGSTSEVPCDDGDLCTINDMQIILDCNGEVCEPCMGITVDCSDGTTSEVACDDGDSCTENDVEIVLDCNGEICQPCMGTAIPEEGLILAGDVFSTDAGELLQDNVLTNDDVSDYDAITIEVISDPMIGAVVLNQDGSFEYQVTSPISEIDNFTYEVCVTACPDICESADVEIAIVLDGLFVPDAFSPNGDGLNETWIIPGLVQYPENKMIVVNRWGTTVFEQRPYQNNWDGTGIGNKPLPEGTYYYYLQLDSGDKEILSGPLTIIR